MAKTPKADEVVTLTLIRDKETKGTYRYTGKDDDENFSVTAYASKSKFPGKAPKSLKAKLKIKA